MSHQNFWKLRYSITEHDGLVRYGMSRCKSLPPSWVQGCRSRVVRANWHFKSCKRVGFGINSMAISFTELLIIHAAILNLTRRQIYAPLPMPCRIYLCFLTWLDIPYTLHSTMYTCLLSHSVSPSLPCTCIYILYTLVRCGLKALNRLLVRHQVRPLLSSHVYFLPTFYHFITAVTVSILLCACKSQHSYHVKRIVYVNVV